MSIPRLATSLSLLTMVLLCLSCGSGQNLPTVRVSGASTVYPIVQMAGDVLKTQKVMRVEAQAGGSTRGFEDNLAGRNDFGAMARELTSSEAAAVNKYPIAYDGVGIAVHADNPVTNLTSEQIRKIYLREITNWKELGGPDSTIMTVNKAEGHATLQVFLTHMNLTRDQVKPDVIAGDNAQVIRAVSNAPNGIGYVSLGEVLHAAEIGIPIKLVSLDGVEPSLDKVADGSFPMFRTLYLVASHEPNGPSQQLLDFLHSDEGHEVIRRGKYVPLR